MSSKRNGAELLVEALIASGVEVIFGVPGDTGIAFYDALHARQAEIRHVLARDERSAASMADAFARSSNRIGVVEASSGGGATFLVGGLGEPYAASVPILALTTDIRKESRGSGAITEIDQSALFTAVTKWQHTVESASEISGLVRKAIKAATTGRPGPVSLVLPENVLDEEAEASDFHGNGRIPIERPQADWIGVQKVMEALSTAQRPAIVAGSGVHLSEAWVELAMFSEQFGVPVSTTLHGKGVFPETNSLSLGVLGANGARDYANDYLAQADWVLFVGTRANATDTNGYTSPPRQGTAYLAQVDIDPARAGHNYPSARVLIGDARTVLAQLRSVAQGPEQARTAAIVRRIADEKGAWEIAQQQFVAPRGLDPREVVLALQEVALQESLLVADAGTPTPYVAAFWQCRTAQRSVLIPRGHGAMGFAIPAAIGAALARPGTPVLSLTTDGSFAMACGELETAKRLELPITFIHFSNETYGWIKMLQRLYTGERYIGVDFTRVQADVVATGFGLLARQVTTIADLQDAVLESQGREGPSFIDIPIAAEQDLMPPVAPWRATLAGYGGRPIY